MIIQLSRLWNKTARFPEKSMHPLGNKCACFSGKWRMLFEERKYAFLGEKRHNSMGGNLRLRLHDNYEFNKQLKQIIQISMKNS